MVAIGDFTKPVNRAGVVLLVAAATATGYLPYAMYAAEPWVLGPFAAVAAIIAAYGVWHTRTARIDSPDFAEWALTFIAAVSIAAVAAFGAICIHIGTDFIGKAIVWVLGRFGVTVAPNLRAISFWLSLVMAMLLGVSNVTLTLRRLDGQIYPRTAGLEPNLKTFVRFQHGRAVRIVMFEAIVILAAMAVVFFLPDWRESGTFNLVLAWALVLVGAPVQGKDERVAQSAMTSITTDGVQALFEAAGYRVTRSPRTGRQDLDPMLVDAPDLFCQGPDRWFAVEVKTEHDVNEADPWAALDDLVSASWALGSYFTSTGNAPAPDVEPLLVQCGSSVPSTARLYESRGRCKVLWIRDPQVLDKLPTIRSDDERRHFALDILRAIDKQPVPPVTSRPIPSIS